MTEEERTFVARMLPHIMAGMSLEEAGRAVLADDERIWLATMADDNQGATIRYELAKEVRNRCAANRRKR